MRKPPHSAEGPERGGQTDFHTAKASEFFARNGGRNPQAIRLRAEPSGDGENYQEIAIRAFRGRDAIADLVVGPNSDGNLRVVCTADGRGDGDRAVALFPGLAAGQMVLRAVCNLGRACANKSEAP